MTAEQPNSFRTGPDERGRFGIYGGRFVSETLMPLILDLEAEYDQRITQRLILQPRLEIDASASDIPELEIGSGL